MKGWLALLVLVTFGVGWTTRALTDRIRQKEAPVEPASETDEPRRPSRGPDRRLLTIRAFSTELELAANQVAELERLIEQVSDEIRSYEEDIEHVLDQSRADVDRLLTAEQKERLEALIRRRYEERGRERAQSILAKVAETHPIPDELKDQVAPILVRYDQDRYGMFRSWGGSGRRDRGRGSDRGSDRGSVGDSSEVDRDREEQDREKRRQEAQDLRDRFVAELEALLEAETVAALMQEMDGGSRRRRRN